MHKKIFHWLRLMALCALLPWVAACSDDPMAGGHLIGYNHTDQSIGYFTVNGQGGAFSKAHSGGGIFYCCVSFPRHWKPDYQVTVGWVTGSIDNYQERVVNVEKYDTSQLGNMDVHFLHNGDIKVFITKYALWHPNYPLQGPEAELDPNNPSKLRQQMRRGHKDQSPP